MRKETIVIYERELMHVVGALLFEMAPNRQPRKAEIIMTKVRDKFREDAFNDNEYYSLRIAKNKLKKYIRELLFSIHEFKELNLTQIEYEKGIDVDDEKRPKYKLLTAHDVETIDSWKTDFIDLDAFASNAYSLLRNTKEDNKECFFCIHSSIKNSEACKSCYLNSDLTNNYEPSREPKGNFTISCKYDCCKGYQICCEECKWKDQCDMSCDSNSSTCGLTILKK